MIVRKANSFDIPILMHFGQQMHAESRYSKFPLSEKKIRDMYMWLIESKEGILFVTDHGFLAGTIEEYWFGHAKHAQEFLLYVLPDWRGNGEAVSLVRAYVQRAKELGAKDIHIEDTTMIQPERNEKFFSRMGFQRVGGNFLMEVN